MKKNIKSGLFFMFFLVILSVFLFRSWLNSSFSLDKELKINKGDSFQVFTKDLGFLDKLKIKANLKLKNKKIPPISVGVYKFSGNYNIDTFLQTVKDGPLEEFVKYTVLEGWSIYDIDSDLSKKGYIKSGEFLKHLTQYKNKIIGQYDFLQDIDKQTKLKTLEGFLYPETYNISLSKSFIKQLLQHQLNTFEKRVWKKHGTKMKNFTQKLKTDGFSSLSLSPLAIIKLSSIIQKEERNIQNAPTVAGIFINRLSNGIQLGADITLCYGLHKPYSKCPPSIIVQNLKDKNNFYNTRVLGGLTPTPISNPTVDTILSVLKYKKTDYFYYLHDGDGNIHYGKTLEEHNQNKNLYLK